MVVVQSPKCKAKAKADSSPSPSPPLRRRSSGRIRQVTLRAEKELLVRRRVDLLDSNAQPPSTANPNPNPIKRRKKAVISSPPPHKSCPAPPKSEHAKIRETLRLFNKYYLHFVQVA